MNHISGAVVCGGEEKYYRTFGQVRVVTDKIPSDEERFPMPIGSKYVVKNGDWKPIDKIVKVDYSVELSAQKVLRYYPDILRFSCEEFVVESKLKEGSGVTNLQSYFSIQKIRNNNLKLAK